MLNHNGYHHVHLWIQQIGGKFIELHGLVHWDCYVNHLIGPICTHGCEPRTHFCQMGQALPRSAIFHSKDTPISKQYLKMYLSLTLALVTSSGIHPTIWRHSKALLDAHARRFSELYWIEDSTSNLPVGQYSKSIPLRKISFQNVQSII